jgi:hypothetical protein
MQINSETCKIEVKLVASSRQESILTGHEWSGGGRWLLWEEVGRLCVWHMRHGGQEVAVRRAVEDATRLGTRRPGGAGGVKRRRWALHFSGEKNEDD